MGKPFVSVLIDTYNHERFIEEAIVSVLEQDFPAADREIHVVDDGSTDHTPEIVRKFQTARKAAAQGECRPSFGLQRWHPRMPRRDRRFHLLACDTKAGFVVKQTEWLEPSPCSSNLGAGSNPAGNLGLRIGALLSTLLGMSDRFALIAQKPDSARVLQWGD